MKDNRVTKTKVFSSVIWIVFGTTFIIRYYKTGDSFLLWAGLFICLAHATSLALHLFKKAKHKNEVPQNLP